MKPIACDLTNLDATARAREIVLLDRFRNIFTSPAWSDGEWTVQLPADPATLSELGEFLALERLCCPFLRFHLTVDDADRARLGIAGPEGSREFIERTFLGDDSGQQGSGQLSAG
jgi:hypothetical protein